MITDEQFESLIIEYIKPLFGIHKVTSCDLPCTQCVSRTSDGKLKISLTPPVARILLKRNQTFSKSELSLLRKIITNWLNAFRKNYPEELLNIIALHALQDAISHHISQKSPDIALKVITLFDSWASETYEGQRISFSIGIDETSKTPPQGISRNFFTICNEDYVKVLTSGCDTVIVLDPQGNVISHESLPFPNVDETHDMRAPLSFLPIANWAYYRKYAICLTRIGEILIFKNKGLLFAKRRGKWKFFTHDAYIKSMHLRSENTRSGFAVRTALYVTMLDTSFQRKGACVGFIAKRHTSNDDFSIIQNDDFLTSSSPKSNFISSLINFKPFHKISRKLRQELLSIDGATIILDDGKIISAGAILRIR